jgi:hypothetical protein
MWCRNSAYPATITAVPWVIAISPVVAPAIASVAATISHMAFIAIAAQITGMIFTMPNVEQFTPSSGDIARASDKGSFHCRIAKHRGRDNKCLTNHRQNQCG